MCTGRQTSSRPPSQIANCGSASQPQAKPNNKGIARRRNVRAWQRRKHAVMSASQACGPSSLFDNIWKPFGSVLCQGQFHEPCDGFETAPNP